MHEVVSGKRTVLHLARKSMECETRSGLMPAAAIRGISLCTET
jgi:hypothetical protein